MVRVLGTWRWACLSSLSVSCPTINAFYPKLLLCGARGNIFTTTRTTTRIIQQMDFSSSSSSTLAASASSEAALGRADIGKQQQQQHSTDASNNEYLPEGTSWRRMLERSSSLARDIRGSNYVQLATVDADAGVPKCRTVVFRGFLPINPDLKSVWENNSRGSCDDLPTILTMTTDARSQKVEQVAASAVGSSSAELVWWFPNSNEQYRIAGDLVFVGASGAPGDDQAGDDENDDDGTKGGGSRTFLSGNPYLQQERVRMWKKLTDAARESFMTDAVPGRPYYCTTPTNGDGNPGTTAAAAGASDPPDSFLLMLLVPHSVDYLRLTNMYRQMDRIENGVWTNMRVNP